MIGVMRVDTLIRFRNGLRNEEFSLTEISEATGIPLQTLSDMKDETWKPKALDRLERLAAAIDQLGGSARRKRKRRS